MVRWVCFLCLCMTGCAGYRFGADSMYPPDIRTVYVPVFESNSFRRDLGERLSEAVAKEIELKTPYKVVGSPQADSVLTGKIQRDAKRVVVESPTDEGREVETNLVVQVQWLNRHGNVLQRCGEIPLDPSLTSVNGQSSFIPEIGESLATSQDKAIKRMAEQIVSLMEQPW